jgi:transcription initiation factor TFIIIB Brf1 subunit/transcription initiation factor TFIIB
LERVLEPGPEWRRRPGETLERADTTAVVDVTQHDLGMGSRFGMPRDVSPSWRASMRRLRELQQRSRVGGWRDRSIREALVELDKLCEELSLPKGIKAEVSVSYRKAKVKRITAGRDLHQVLAALVFITCRMRFLPRTEDEIFQAAVARFGGKKHVGLRSFRKLVRLLSGELKLKLPRISTDDYIDRFSPQLGLSKEAVECAHRYSKLLPKNFTQSKSPFFLAALVLYLAAESTGEKITLAEVAHAIGVGVSSLSKNLSLVRRFVGGEQQ